MEIATGSGTRPGRRTPVTAGHHLYPSVLLAAGLVAAYIGERMLQSGTASVALDVLGGLLILAAVATRAVVVHKQASRDRGGGRWLLVLYGLAAAAVALHFITDELVYRSTGRMFDQLYPRLGGVVEVLWPALLLMAMLPILFVELSLAGMKSAPVLDQGRVGAAMMSGLGLAFALVFCFCVSYVASERDIKADFSYFRTARAGESTKKLVRALDKTIKVYLFFPPANEVREEVESYFGDLTGESKQLVIEHYDQALHPAKARELGVNGNGTIVFGRDTLREQMTIPLTLENARARLKNLDHEVHKRIIGVSRANRIAYFTQGHEEAGTDGNENDQRPVVAAMRELLVDLGFEPKELGLAHGLATDVPKDATVVITVGPRKPFMKEELASLERYLDRHGRLLLALDPEWGQPMEPLLTGLGLKWNPITLANDELHIKRTYQNTDRVNLATGSYASHSSVSTISRFGMRAPVIMFGAGYLEKLQKEAVGLVNVDFTVHADINTWNDKNGNFQFDQAAGETRGAYELVAAVTRRNAGATSPENEARVLVLADADAVGDFVIRRNPANVYLTRDALRWLSGDESVSGPINTEEDVPVTHTRKQDVAWFYSSIFAAPALVVALGLVVTRKRRRKKTNAAPAEVKP